MTKLPDTEESLWRESYQDSLFSALEEDLEVDVAIIGAGITGLTCAYLLTEAGLKVAVLEKRTVGAGTTGRTTGKVTSQHGLIYNDLGQRLGTETARVYADANQTAVQQVESIIKAEKIDCDWELDDNYVFTDDPSQVSTFKQEAKVAAAAGLPASFVTKTPLPFPVRAAVKFTNQAKMNSIKYVSGLAKAVQANGGHVFENSRVIGIRDGQPGRIRTSKASVVANNIIVATNVPTLPLMARGGFCVMEYPTESYIVAARLKKPVDGMYISPDKHHYSILPIDVGGDPYLLIGGEGHISGLRIKKNSRYQRLADYATKHFEIEEISYRWSDRDYLAYDGVPLIGKLYPWSKNLYVATAYRKWGLSNSTLAAMILRDLITGKPNAWAATFSSNRLKPIASIPRVAAKYLTGNS
jgi:glycine/D-amino acid oxidase-like deaminating enzyme